MPITDPSELTEIIKSLQEENIKLLTSLSDAKSKIFTLQQQLFALQREYDEEKSKFSLFKSLLGRNK